LDFAIKTGLEHGGYVPEGPGRPKTERIDDRYNLVGETQERESYARLKPFFEFSPKPPGNENPKLLPLIRSPYESRITWKPPAKRATPTGRSSGPSKTLQGRGTPTGRAPTRPSTIASRDIRRELVSIVSAPPDLPFSFGEFVRSKILGFLCHNWPFVRSARILTPCHAPQGLRSVFRGLGEWPKILWFEEDIVRRKDLRGELTKSSQRFVDLYCAPVAVPLPMRCGYCEKNHL
jgi:hypothetical protein